LHQCSIPNRQPLLADPAPFGLQELAAFWRVNVLNTGIVFVLFSVPTIIPVATFAAYLLLGHSLSSTQAFVSLALFNLLRFPLFMLPMLLQQLTTARVSLGRLQDFLMAEALEEVPPLPAAAPGKEVAVSLSGDFTWDSKGLASLIDVSIDVQAGQLVVIIGSTGSGKTTVLSAMLGQMQQVCIQASFGKKKKIDNTAGDTVILVSNRQHSSIIFNPLHHK